MTRDLIIHECWLEERFIRASGPGGQNVNRVATAVQLRFDLEGCADITEDVRERLRRLAGKRLTGDGILQIDARRFRTQESNRRDARRRLRELVIRALKAPRKRRATRPSQSAVRRRLESKHRRKMVKAGRRRVEVADGE